MLRCYSCNTSEELGVKARYKTGAVRLMICKTCRREKQKKYIPGAYQRKIEYKNLEDWTKLAKENHERIINKWANKNQLQHQNFR